MTTIFADAALLQSGWAHNVRISVVEHAISALELGTVPQPQDERHALIIPGLANLHSHAFQRGMAGLAEMRGPGSDSFWSWRTNMYRFAQAVSPTQLQAIAAQLYVEMLEQGFTRVGEFHYLHNDKDGSAYGQPAELAYRVAAAAETTGIGLTLLPVFYAHAGFGGAAATAMQQRFVLSLDAYARLLEQCRVALQRLPGGKLGVAPHSLRAVTPQQLAEVVVLANGGPIHIHIAEQVKEVEDCIAWSKARPVQWLLDNTAVNACWTLIHATHINDAETRAMAASGAVAGLCPITEANLGDGVFPAPAFLDAGGRFGIGSDSNIRISLPQELQMLEYSQRLALRARNVIAHPEGSTGERLFTEALRGGATALQASSHLAVGGDADFVSLDASAIPHMPLSAMLDAWIFSQGPKVDCVWVRGQKRVDKGRHTNRDAVAAVFRATMRALMEHME